MKLTVNFTNLHLRCRAGSHCRDPAFPQVLYANGGHHQQQLQEQLLYPGIVTELCVLGTFGGVEFSLTFICAQSVPEFLWNRLRASIQFPVMPKRAQYARFSGEVVYRHTSSTPGWHGWFLPGCVDVPRLQNQWRVRVYRNDRKFQYSSP